MDAVWRDIAADWATLPSVQSNNSIQEYWTAPPDSIHTYSHCPYAPLIILQHGLMGLFPVEPGFGVCRMLPNLRGLQHDIHLTYHTVKGPIVFEAVKCKGGFNLTIFIPRGMRLILQLEDKALEFIGPATIAEHLHQR
jgi:hypothetical protein